MFYQIAIILPSFRFYDWTCQSALTLEARQEYIKKYSKLGAMCAELVYYRAVFEDAEQNKTKSMPTRNYYMC